MISLLLGALCAAANSDQQKVIIATRRPAHEILPSEPASRRPSEESHCRRASTRRPQRSGSHLVKAFFEETLTAGGEQCLLGRQAGAER